MDIILLFRRKKAENSWMLPGLDAQIESEHKSVSKKVLLNYSSRKFCPYTSETYFVHQISLIILMHYATQICFDSLKT